MKYNNLLSHVNISSGSKTPLALGNGLLSQAQTHQSSGYQIGLMSNHNYGFGHNNED